MLYKSQPLWYRWYRMHSGDCSMQPLRFGDSDVQHQDVWFHCPDHHVPHTPGIPTEGHVRRPPTHQQQQRSLSHFEYVQSLHALVAAIASNTNFQALWPTHKAAERTFSRRLVAAQAYFCTRSTLRQSSHALPKQQSAQQHPATGCCDHTAGSNATQLYTCSRRQWRHAAHRKHTSANTAPRSCTRHD